MFFAVRRELSIDEDEIKWLPLSKLYQYAHCALLYSGVATEWSHVFVDDDLKQSIAILKAQQAKKNGTR